MENATPKKGMKSRIVMLFIAVFLSFVVKDAITAFADCLLPIETVSLTLVPCLDDEVRGVRVIKEDKKYEAFDLFLDALAKQPDGEACGWNYIEGEVGISWTRIETGSEGAVLQASLRANPKYYLAMIADRWSGAVDLRVNGRMQKHIELFKNIDIGDIVRVYPFMGDNRVLYIRIVLHVLAAATFYLLIYLGAERSNRTDGKGSNSESGDAEADRA